MERPISDSRSHVPDPERPPRPSSSTYRAISYFSSILDEDNIGSTSNAHIGSSSAAGSGVGLGGRANTSEKSVQPFSPLFTLSRNSGYDLDLDQSTYSGARRYTLGHGHGQGNGNGNEPGPSSPLKTGSSPRQSLGNGTGKADADRDEEGGIRKKVKLEIAEETGSKVKKTRQTQSCDACRARKVKCDRPPPGQEVSPNHPARDTCTHCEQLGMACTFEYKPKKRGPPNMYLKKLQEMQEQETGTSASGFNESQTSAALAQISVHGLPGIGAPGLPSPSSGISLSHSGDWTQLPPIDTSGIPSTLAGLQPTPSSDTLALTPTLNMLNHLPFARLRGSPSTSWSNYAHILSSPDSNPFDRILPRAQLMYIIDLYFDYVYPLIPALHKPSFMRDLNGRREERVGEEEWIALVLSVVCATLVQLPRGFGPLSRAEARGLVAKCMGIVKSYIISESAELTVYRLIVLYIITSMILGERSYATSFYLGASYALSYRLGLYDEKTYAGLAPIERELARRIFWLQYGGNVSGKVIDSSIFAWHYDDNNDVQLPRILDDEYITETEYLEQPKDQTPVLAGFWYTSRLYQLLSHIIEKRRQDRKKPPMGKMVTQRLREIEELSNQILTLMDDCPEPLKIDMAGTPATRMDNISIEWDAHLSLDIKQLLSGQQTPTGGQSNLKDSFLVQQANIYVSQQMARYVVIQYREELLALQDTTAGTPGLDANGAEVGDAIGVGEGINGISEQAIGTGPPPPALARSTSAFRPGKPSLRTDKSKISEAEKDQVASDLLVILSKIPLDVLAVNTTPLVHKIRLVAGTLLDVLQQTPASSHEPTAEEVQVAERMNRAQNYLWDFLRIMSEIEAAFSMEDDLKDGQ